METPDFSMTTLEAAMANALAAVKIQVSQFNEQLKGNYLTAFNNWSQNVIAGRVDNTDPPKPPLAYVVGFFTDPTNSKAQWAYPMTGTSPVCDMPPVPPSGIHLTDQGGIGIQIAGSDYFQCLAGDKTPGGAVVPGVSKDGKSGLFRKVPSPFGSDVNTGAVGGWWLKIGALLLCLFAVQHQLAHAQIALACAPQPMAATASLGKVAIGEWACWAQNSGTTPEILTPGALYQAIIGAGRISPVTPAVAQQILNDSVNRLPQSKLVKVGQVGIALGGIAATLYTGNAQWSLIGGLISQNAPRMITVIQNEIPSTAPFVGGQLSGPVTIVPGADLPPITIFAMKTKAANLIPFIVKL